MQHNVITSSRLRFLLAVCFLACILALGASGTNDGEVYAEGGGMGDTIVRSTVSMGPLAKPVATESDEGSGEMLSPPSTSGELFVWVSLLLF